MVGTMETPFFIPCFVGFLRSRLRSRCAFPQGMVLFVGLQRGVAGYL